MTEDNLKYQCEVNGLSQDEPLFSISTTAKIVGLSKQSLHLYEREHLIIPYKKASGHRLYSLADIDRLHCIREMITDRKISIQGIKGMLSLLPCWKVVNCSEKDRKNCEAYENSFKPCWAYEHKNNVCAKLDCRTCEVYKKYGRCSEIKKVIRDVTDV
jgi:MerR family transcriptional regulator/heat shock protein HspR